MKTATLALKSHDDALHHARSNVFPLKDLFQELKVEIQEKPKAEPKTLRNPVQFKVSPVFGAQGLKVKPADEMLAVTTVTKNGAAKPLDLMPMNRLMERMGKKLDVETALSRVQEAFTKAAEETWAVYVPEQNYPEGKRVKYMARWDIMGLDDKGDEVLLNDVAEFKGEGLVKEMCLQHIRERAHTLLNVNLGSGYRSFSRETFAPLR